MDTEVRYPQKGGTKILPPSKVEAKKSQIKKGGKK
jgi:hypothetical protein